MNNRVVIDLCIAISIKITNPSKMYKLMEK